MAWNRERLEEVAQTRLGGAKLIVVANREPYIHRYRDGEIEWIRPAGGLTTALDPSCAPAAASGSPTAPATPTATSRDAHGRVRVPPDDPSYTLRRVWLTKDEEEGYYYGFANSTLWPLCHQVFCRPTFDPAHWDVYREVNETLRRGRPRGSARRPGVGLRPGLPLRPAAAAAEGGPARTWWWRSSGTSPGPTPRRSCVCPWAKEMLDGMLGNDLLGFHTQHHCNNFLETVDRALECRIDREKFAVTRGGHETRVRPFPISVDPDLAPEYLGDDWEAAGRWRCGSSIGWRTGRCWSAWTGSITPRASPSGLRAVDRLLEQHPELKGTFHFLQVGAPSRTHLPAYRDLDDEVQDLAERINWQHGTDRLAAGRVLERALWPAGDHAALPDGGGLRGEFAARRDESGGQGVRGRSRRRAGGAGALAVHGSGPGVDRRGAGQPV